MKEEITKQKEALEGVTMTEDTKALNNVSDIDTSKVEQHSLRVAQRIINSNNVEEVKDLTHLFNLTARKKNVLRVMKMSELLDKVTDQVFDRFEQHPDNFSNDDLIKYMQVTENAIDRANKQLNLVDETPPIQVMQNNQVNITVGSELSRESREKVFGIVEAFLAKAKEHENVIEVKDEEIKDESDII